jgi:hypothetical protein
VDVLYDVILVLHFVGLASLLGGWLVQLTEPDRVMSNAMLHGALTQVVTGLLLVGIAEASLDADVDQAKIGIKLLVALVVLGLVWVNRRREAVPSGLFMGIGALTLANVVVAVFV